MDILIRRKQKMDNINMRRGSTSMMAQTTLRSVLGQSQLDDLLAKREEINGNLQLILDQQTEP